MKRRVWISFPNGPKLTTRWGHMPMLMGGLAGMIEHLKLRNWVDAVCTSNSLQTSIPVHVSLSLSCDRCMYISRVADCLKFPMSGMWYILYGYWCLKIRNKHAMYSHISIKTYKNHQGPTKKTSSSIAWAISIFQKVRAALEEPVHDFCSKMLWEHPSRNLSFGSIYQEWMMRSSWQS